LTAAQGRWPQATRNLEQALELDPRNFLMLQQLALIYEAQARYADEDQAYQRALTIKPGDPTTRLYRTEVQVIWRADLRPYQTFVGQLTAENPVLAAQLEDVIYAFCERTPAAMERSLRSYPDEGVIMNDTRVPKSYWQGVMARFQGDAAGTRAAFNLARQQVEEQIRSRPESAASLSLLGLIDAGLDRKEDAIRAGLRACEIAPVSKDAINGVALVANLAEIYAWSGEKDLAIDRIVKVHRVPNYLAYGLLKLHPVWDPLRGEPRFEELVASLAPKDAATSLR